MLRPSLSHRITGCHFTGFGRACPFVEIRSCRYSCNLPCAPMIEYAVVRNVSLGRRGPVALGTDDLLRKRMLVRKPRSGWRRRHILIVQFLLLANRCTLFCLTTFASLRSTLFLLVVGSFCIGRPGGVERNRFLDVDSHESYFDRIRQAAQGHEGIASGRLIAERRSAAYSSGVRNYPMQ